MRPAGPRLEWPGKAAALALASAPARSGLVPALDPVAPAALIVGDNLEALRLLLPAHRGAARLVYLDPPYNTGHDLPYHDDRARAAWLDELLPRLALSIELLAEDGLLCVSIDDREVAPLRLLLDELLGPEATLGTLVWRSRRSVDTRARTGLSSDHEYVVIARRGGAARLGGVPVETGKFRNPDGDPRGPWRSADLTGLAGPERRPNLHYTLEDPATGRAYAAPPRGWRYDRDTMARKIAEGRVLWPAAPQGRPRHKLFLGELRSRNKNLSSWLDGPSTADGTRGLEALLGRVPFPYPKPVALLRLLVQQCTAPRRGDLIVDVYAGTGTLGEAVLRQNAEDGGDRRLIGIQRDEPTGREDWPSVADITAARLERVAARHGAVVQRARVAPTSG